MNSSVSVDNNFFSIYAQSDIRLDNQDFRPPTPNRYASALKISHSSGISGKNIRAAQCSENSVDINVCHNLFISGDFGVGGGYGDQVITIKGGSENIWISGVIHSNGGRGRVQVGQWSDQSYNLSRNIVLNLTTEEGKPVDVVVGRATNVVLQGTCVRTWYRDWMLVSYWWIKWAVRKALGIPVGQKGPSWI